MLREKISSSDVNTAKVWRSVSAVSLSLLLPALTACDSTSSDGSSDPGISTGVFVDSPVANIAYRTATQSGFTNENGEYNYRGGEQVTFSIGGIELPSAPARRTVTPLDLVGTDKVDDVAVLNISRLLISLDIDGNPDNGITLSDSVESMAQGLSVDFTSSDFDDTVSNLVANSGSVNTSLVSANEAQSHLQEQLALIPPDRDDDGVIDTEDLFPDDPNESSDRDGDGVGDNGDFAPDDAAIQSICQTDASADVLEEAGCNNLAPVAVFDGTQSVRPSIAVNLDGSGSFDPEGRALTYQWSIESKPDGATVSIQNPTAVTATLISGDLEGAYVIRLSVTDDFSVTTSVDQTVTVDKSLPTSAGLFGTSLLVASLLLIRGRRERRR